MTGPMGGRLQPGGHTAQPTEMRRTASHNNAFSSGLGAPLGSSSGLSDHSSPGHTNGSSINTGSIHNSEQSTIGGGLANAQLAPFSLSQMTRSPRRSSPNPPEHRIPLSYDQGSPVQTSVPSPLTEDKHPLQHTWTLYYDITSGNNRQGTLPHNYESGLKDLGTFSTVELFARYFNWIEKPHKMEIGANYHLFKDGIKPMWEDAANANGGRWVVTLQLQYRGLDLLDRCWMELAYALVGEQLDVGDDICGAVLSRRKVDRLAVWVRDKDNVEAVNGIGFVTQDPGNGHETSRICILLILACFISLFIENDL
ncbi:translation initiation factor eIF 4e-like domain-containing protein [Mortierella sp. GBAus27b]|nr:translation initiation factor eIF 4e-like domain-containing protein [Mortierella sp. GBAus27b]